METGSFSPLVFAVPSTAVFRRLSHLAAHASGDREKWAQREVFIGPGGRSRTRDIGLRGRRRDGLFAARLIDAVHYTALSETGVYRPVPASVTRCQTVSERCAALPDPLRLDALRAL